MLVLGLDFFLDFGKKGEGDLRSPTATGTVKVFTISQMIALRILVTLAIVALAGSFFPPLLPPCVPMARCTCVLTIPPPVMQ